MTRKHLALGALLASAAIGAALAYGLAQPDDAPLASGGGMAVGAQGRTASAEVSMASGARRLAFAPPGALQAQALVESTPPTLVGLSRGQRTVAFLTLQGQSARLTVGESLQGWKVLAISEHGVVVRRSGKPVRLDLYNPQAR